MARYTVTDLAPPKIAGRRVRTGETIEVEAALVRYEIDHGQIVAAEVEAEPLAGAPAPAEPEA